MNIYSVCGLFSVTRRSRSDSVSQSVSESVTLRTELTDVTLVSEDFTDETLAIDDNYGDDVREIVVLVMEMDK